MIVQDLVGGPRRFRALLSHLAPINDKVLSQRLKELEEAGILHRQVFAEVPIRVEYSLTTKGSDMVGIIKEMQRWDATWAGGRIIAAGEDAAHGSVPVLIAGHHNGNGVAYHDGQEVQVSASTPVNAAPLSGDPRSPEAQHETSPTQAPLQPPADRDLSPEKGKRRFWNRLGL